MIFATYVNGIPCLCEVKHHAPAKPLLITGTGYGDADPPESEEFDYDILDRNHNPAPELLRRVDAATEQRLLEEYRVMRDAEYYDPE